MGVPPEIVQPDDILHQADVQGAGEPAPALPMTAGILANVADVQVTPITPPTETTPQTILRGASDIKVALVLTATQRAGLRLLWAIGALIAALMIEAAIVWAVSLPNLPALPTYARTSQAGATPSGPTAAQVIADSRTLDDAARDRSLSLIDGLVVKILLPVFTTILGYVFGTRQIEGNNNSSQ